jgi:hypothetical protein
MMRRWTFGAALVLGLASVLVARQGIVHTDDGRTLEGDVDESAGPSGKVVVTIHGVAVTLPRDDILSIEYPKDITQEFNERLARLDSTDARGRAQLARWALSRGQFELARKAADAAQRLAPNDPEIQTLQDTIEAQQRLASRQPSGTPAPAPTPPPPTPPTTPPPSVPATQPAPPVAEAPPTTSPSGGPARFLTMDQVYAIRRAELRPDENVRIQFYRDVQKRYLALSKANAAAFSAASPTVQALAIQAYDPQLANDVRIMSDPRGLADFRSRIEPRVLAGCASSGCHSGSEGGDFFLYTNVRSAQASYTNFFILTTYQRKVDTADVFGRGVALRMMIDRLHAQSSLLVQYALPRMIASTPHPDVPNWKPMFWRSDDPGCLELVNWIGTTLRPITPDYGFKFELANSTATTQPSTPTTSP